MKGYTPEMQKTANLVARVIDDAVDFLAEDRERYIGTITDEELLTIGRWIDTLSEIHREISMASKNKGV